MKEVNTALEAKKSDHEIAVEAVLISLITAAARNTDKTRLLSEMQHAITERLSTNKNAFNTASELISIANSKL
ncbi:hypothetical protein I6H07_05770 [Hafnia alvei]|uniref:hypothetical protein n=1 Tax=Hafnia alvei TaxID=569 RepID=UPI000B6A508D|nr:hypothetical protein [Hafnia alvei]MBI0275342.1 hypothetical protein [Hafnia alvei]PNK98657.1 hypothetical protein CEQ28_014220 [Hafnia alvei]